MNDGPSPTPARIFYHGRYRRTSLFWLIVSLLFGGTFLCVYFTVPDAPVADLIGAVILGVPPFVLSMISLGRYKAVILLPDLRKLCYVSGLFQRRTIGEHDYSEVSEVEALQGPETDEPYEMGWITRITLTGGKAIILEESSRGVARDHVSGLRVELGLVHPGED